MTTTVVLIICCLLVLGSEFVNGWTDAPNAIATAVSTRVLTPTQAIFMAVIMNVTGAVIGMWTGTAVAETLGTGIVDPKTINLLTISAALVGIIVWGSIAAKYGIPTSESHALVAGLAGAGLATGGIHSLQWHGWLKVFIGIGTSLILGLLIAWFSGKLIIKVFADVHPEKGKRIFKWAQRIAAGMMALSHGLNDGQKFMGVFTLALVMGGVLPTFHVPLWVILLCASVMGIGTSFGGKEIIGTLGEKITKLESWQGFAALVSSSGAITVASFFGIPISSTHTIVSSVAGAGMSRSKKAVRWKHPRLIVLAAICTFPFCGGLAYLICISFQLIQKLF